DFNDPSLRNSPRRLYNLSNSLNILDNTCVDLSIWKQVADWTVPLHATWSTVATHIIFGVFGGRPALLQKLHCCDLNEFSLRTFMPATAAFDTQPATLLVIDDDSSARENLCGIFKGVGHRTIAVADAPAALRVLKKDRCDLVMLDLELPEIDGVSLCR